MFLRCELFNAELAAQRIGNYWNRRIELFGANRAFKPLNLGRDGALSSVHSSDDGNINELCDASEKHDESMVQHTLKGLSLGFVRPTLTHDSGGRAIMFADPSRLSGYNKKDDAQRLGVARAMWYVMHSILEGNHSVQKIGVVMIVYPHNAKVSVIDRKLMKMNFESISGCIPLRIGGIHICHPPWFFGKIVYPIMKVIMSERMRKRIRVQSGSEERVLENLKGYGLGREVLPSEIGGGCHFGYRFVDSGDEEPGDVRGLFARIRGCV